MTGKEILKDVDKSKKDIIKGYKWGGKKIKGLKK